MLSIIQKNILITLYKYDQASGYTRAYSSADIKDRGVDTPIHSIGASARSLVTRNFLKVTERASYNNGTKYEITKSGKKFVKEELLVKELEVPPVAGYQVDEEDEKIIAWRRHMILKILSEKAGTIRYIIARLRSDYERIGKYIRAITHEDRVVKDLKEFEQAGLVTLYKFFDVPGGRPLQLLAAIITAEGLRAIKSRYNDIEKSSQQK